MFKRMYCSNKKHEFSKSVFFVLNSNPGEDQLEWQSYFMVNHETKELVAPYYEIGNDHKKHSSFKLNLKQVECGLIWNKFIWNNY